MSDNIITVARETIRVAEKLKGIEEDHPVLLLLARAVVRHFLKCEGKQWGGGE